MEVRYGRFERVFGLPHRLDFEAISATYRDGFLYIEIPRNEKSRREITVEIH
jgi:HSP20 family molecular chaperone IbpA